MARLLVVHSDPLVEGLLELAFRHAGHTVECRPDAEAALNLMQRSSELPDALVVQLDLPRDDGVGLALRARELLGTRPLPVLLVMDVPDRAGHGRMAAAALPHSALFDQLDEPREAATVLARLLAETD